MLRRAWPVPVCAVVVAAIVYAAWPLAPKRYESRTTFLLVPQRVTEDVVRPANASATFRLQNARQQVLSRTLLERLVTELDLYPDLRRRFPMGDVVERMRQDVEARVVPPKDAGGELRIEVAFVSIEPKKAMEVADRLSATVINEMLQDRQVLAEATHDFLESQVAETRDRLLTNAKAMATARAARKDDDARVLVLEWDVIEAAYKSLLAKREDSRLRVALEQRGMGEQFKVLDRARVPEQPLGPTRTGAAAVGGVVGGLLGLLWMALRASKPRV